MPDKRKADETSKGTTPQRFHNNGKLVSPPAKRWGSNGRPIIRQDDSYLGQTSGEAPIKERRPR
jgi:hypothetical protein